MGLRAWVKRQFARKVLASAEATAFPVEAFWRSVSNQRQPVLLVKGDGLEVLAANEEARELFGNRNTYEISSLLKGGLDPHTTSRIQIAVSNPVALVTDLPIRMQSPDIYVNVNVTVSTLPEYPEKNAALLYLKDNRLQAFPVWGQMTRELLSRLQNPAWVVDPGGIIVFSNSSVPQFPLEINRFDTLTADDYEDDEEFERLSVIKHEMDNLPAKVRNGDAVSDVTFDLGKRGRWRLLHFPLMLGDGAGFVGVIALPLDMALAGTTPDSDSDWKYLSGVLGQDALTHVLQVKEAERSALAREVHDSLGQELTVLKLELRRLSNIVLSTTPSNTVVEHFNSVRSLVDKLTKTARRIAYEMRQDLVSVHGLAHSVQELVLDLRNRLGLQIQLEISQGWVEPEHGMAHHLHRSLQEMLNNVSKHAKASRCLVRMGLDESIYWLEVGDNGIGMPAVRTTRSIGLRSLSERAEIYGGVVNIRTRPEVDGTLVRMELSERRKNAPAMGSHATIGQM